MTMRRQVLWVGALGVALLAAGCGGGDDAGGAGWVGGEPAWERGADAGGAMADSAAGAAAPGAEAATGSDVGAPVAAVEGLRAGSVDDNADYEGFLAYLARHRVVGDRHARVRRRRKGSRPRRGQRRVAAAG